MMLRNSSVNTTGSGWAFTQPRCISCLILSIITTQALYRNEFQHMPTTTTNPPWPLNNLLCQSNCWWHIRWKCFRLLLGLWQQDYLLVTQLVVHRCYRQRALANGLLACLKSNVTSDIYRIMSSHPASIMATASTFWFTVDGIDIDFIRVNAEGVIQASPIPYVRDAKLCGLLFGGFDASTELVCGRIPTSLLITKNLKRFWTRFLG